MREEIRGNASTLVDMRALHEIHPNGINGEMAAIRIMQQERDALAEKVRIKFQMF